MNVSVTSLRSIIKNDLNLPPCKMRKRQYLTLFIKQKILGKANILLESFEGRARNRFFWWKTLIEAFVNNQNDSVYTKSSAVIDESVRIIYHRQKPFSLMESSNIGSQLWFLWNRGLRSTQMSTLIIFWFQLLKRWKKTFQRLAFYFQMKRSTIPHLNKNSRLVQTSFSKVLEYGDVASCTAWFESNWFFGCGLCWKQRSLLLLIQVLILWRHLLREYFRKCLSWLRIKLPIDNKRLHVENRWL